jgi:hypothetical protein
MNFPAWFPRLFHPPVYQGKKNPSKYFEGWYYKHVDATGKHIWSVIFGISFASDSHSFIQIIEGNSGKTDYIRFGRDEFTFSKKQLMVEIGKNAISEKHIALDLEGETFSIKGRVDIEDTSPFPQRILSPGIMGWYTYAPFMECYHGVVSMNHSLKGSFTINGKEVDFTGGKGYIEKDWGRSMPSDWIWVQCNHFEEDPGMSMMVSIARIPWLTGHFPGFLSFIRCKGEVFQFATYNRSRIEAIEITGEEVSFILKNRRNSLEVRIKRSLSGSLQAPVHGEMDRKIAETLDATVWIRLSDRKGRAIFEGSGHHGGLEVVGDIASYIKD